MWAANDEDSYVNEQWEHFQSNYDTAGTMMKINTDTSQQ